MIRKMSHATIFVNNQDEALSFYRDKLGFKVHTDAMVGPDFRWLTMNTADQPDFEIVLMEPKPGMLMDEETSPQLRADMARRNGRRRFQHRQLSRNLRRLEEQSVEFVAEPAENHTVLKRSSKTTPETGSPHPANQLVQVESKVQARAQLLECGDLSPLSASCHNLNRPKR